jgi:hypothetical protein
MKKEQVNELSRIIKHRRSLLVKNTDKGATISKTPEIFYIRGRTKASVLNGVVFFGLTA